MTELENILRFQPFSSILSAKPIYLLKQCVLKNLFRCFKMPDSSKICFIVLDAYSAEEHKHTEKQMMCNDCLLSYIHL